MRVLYDKRKNESVNSDLIRRYGSFSIAWSLQQAGLTRYENSKGLIYYHKTNKCSFILGDPVCSQSDLDKLLDSFFRTVKNCCFVQVSEQTARALNKLGYKINYFGSESIIHLPYSMEGKEKSEIRNLYNAAIRHNLSFRELSNIELINIQDVFKNKREFRFLIRPIDMDDQSLCRVFGAYQNNKLICLSIFDPIFLNNKVIGYSESINRRSDDAPKGARVFTLIHASEVFSVENTRFINLGLLPFFPKRKESENRFTQNSLTATLFQVLYNSSPFFHNFKGLSFHKSRYNGSLLPKYFASKKKIPIEQLLQIYKLTTGSYLPGRTD